MSAHESASNSQATGEEKQGLNIMRINAVGGEKN